MMLPRLSTHLERLSDLGSVPARDSPLEAPSDRAEVPQNELAREPRRSCMMKPDERVSRTGGERELRTEDYDIISWHGWLDGRGARGRGEERRGGEQEPSRCDFMLERETQRGYTGAYCRRVVVYGFLLQSNRPLATLRVHT